MKKGMRFLTLGIMVVLLVASGNIACKKAVEQTAEGEQAVAAPTNEYEGAVKVGAGKYLYLPQAQGYDVVIQGQISPSTSELVGKTIKVKGEMNVERPSLLIAESIELKEGEGQYRPIFTRTEEPSLSDFFEPRDRDVYQLVEISNINKSEDWEGKGKIKVLGKIQKGNVNYIIIYDAKDREIGKIILDSATDYALYYDAKLRLFDKHIYYLNAKESVDRKLRAKNREMFHADLAFTGLY